MTAAPDLDVSAMFGANWSHLVGWFTNRRAPDPEDLASQTFLRVVQAQPVVLTRSYLYCVAYSVWVDFVRRTHAVRAGGQAQQASLIDADRQHQGPDVFARLEDRLDLRSAVCQLTPLQRHAVARYASGASACGSDRAERKARARAFHRLRGLLCRS